MSSIDFPLQRVKSNPPRHKFLSKGPQPQFHQPADHNSPHGGKQLPE
jgi:hypothetical protein